MLRGGVSWSSRTAWARSVRNGGNGDVRGQLPVLGEDVSGVMSFLVWAAMLRECLVLWLCGCRCALFHHEASGVSHSACVTIHRMLCLDWSS